jgi:hypothetical protein
VRCDSSPIETLTSRDRFALNLGVAKGLERNHNPVRHLAVETILIEERTPQGQRRGVAIR